MKNKKLSLDQLRVNSFATAPMSRIKSGLDKIVDGSFGNCDTDCIGDHCQPDISNFC